MAIDHQMPVTHCPECGLKLDCASDHFGQGLPEPGDIAVCICCMAILRYTADLQVRLTTLAERSSEPELETIVRGVQMAQLRRPDLTWGRKR